MRRTGPTVFDTAPLHVSPRPASTFSRAPQHSRVIPLIPSMQKQVDLACSPGNELAVHEQILMVDKTGHQQPLRTHRTGVSPTSPRRSADVRDERHVIRTRALRSSLTARPTSKADPIHTKSLANSTGGTLQPTQTTEVPKLNFANVRPNSRFISRSAREVPSTESPQRMGSSSARWQKLDWAWGAPERERRGRSVPVHCASTITTSPANLEFRFDSMYATGIREGWAIRKDRSTGRWQGGKVPDTEAGKYGQWTSGVEESRPFTAGVRNNAWNYHWQTAQDWATARQWQETRQEGTVRPSRTR